jgi:hypothetical protein
LVVGFDRAAYGGGSPDDVEIEIQKSAALTELVSNRPATVDRKNGDQWNVVGAIIVADWREMRAMCGCYLIRAEKPGRLCAGTVLRLHFGHRALF